VADECVLIASPASVVVRSQSFHIALHVGSFAEPGVLLLPSFVSDWHVPRLLAAGRESTRCYKHARLCTPRHTCRRHSSGIFMRFDFIQIPPN